MSTDNRIQISTIISLTSVQEVLKQTQSQLSNAIDLQNTYFNAMDSASKRNATESLVLETERILQNATLRKTQAIKARTTAQSALATAQSILATTQNTRTLALEESIMKTTLAETAKQAVVTFKETIVTATKTLETAQQALETAKQALETAKQEVKTAETETTIITDAIQIATKATEKGEIAYEKVKNKDIRVRKQAEKDRLAQEQVIREQTAREQTAQIEKDRLAQIEKDRLAIVAQAQAKFNVIIDNYIKSITRADNVKNIIKNESVNSYNKAQAAGLSYDQSSKIGDIIARKVNNDIKFLGPNGNKNRKYIFVHNNKINPILSQARTETDKLIKEAKALQENFSNTEENTSSNIIWYIILILIIMLILYVMTKK